MARTELDRIRESIDGVVEYLEANPEAGRVTDSAAVATVEDGLRVSTEGPSGYVVVTDMPEAVGGDATGESPGWLFRAGLASCDATLLRMRAAQQGIDLTTLEVTVDSESDDRGMLGVGDAVPAGPLRVRTHVRLDAEGIDADRLRDLVSWVDEHSPVADLVRREVRSDLDIDIG